MTANNIPLDIKDDSLIITKSLLEDGTNEILIKHHNPLNDKIIYLSDVFNFLPSGIVCKDETGMGATHLELIASRPSIIVEPLKITASSKANKHGAVYYGSTTALEPKPTAQEVRDKLMALPPEKRKIVVVADSLKKIREILKEEFKEYFLMIDEADSFQIDSTFRNSMALCLDIYKEHPADRRALVTATPLAFSDIDLQDERTILIKYDIPKPRNIDLIHCDNINGTAIEVIKGILAKYPDDKIMVAYNSVTGCLDIAKHLVTKESQQQEDIKILCSSSSNSKNKAGDYFHELKTDTLPAKINLLTSAYFTGFDLHESYHLVSVSDGNNPIFLLSDKRLKQVSGRCRQKLLTETVVYSTSQSIGDMPKVKDMIDAANIEIKALECIRRNYEDSPLLKTNLLKIRAYIIDHTEDKGAQFLRQDINGEIAINYLSIDACIEDYRVKRTLYQNMDQLPTALINEGHEVNSTSKKSNIHVDKITVDKVDREKQVNDIINEIVDKDIAELQSQLHDNITNLESTIIETCIEFKPYIEKADIIKILKTLSGDPKKFNNLIKAAYFLTLPDSDNYKNIVYRHFVIGSSFTRRALFDTWNRIYAETGLGMNKKSVSLRAIVHWTKLHFKTTPNRNIPKGEPTEIKIIRINPKGFKVIKTRKDPMDKSKLNKFFS